MAQLHRSVAGLRVMGDDLVADEVTALLGAAPSFTRAKGDRVGGVDALTNVWSVQAADAEPGDLDAQVREILGRLTGNLEIWRELGQKFRVDVFCGVFMRGDNEGFALSPQVLLALGQRGITLDHDLYAP